MSRFDREIQAAIDFWVGTQKKVMQDNGALNDVSYYIKKGDMDTVRQLAMMDQLNKMLSGRPSVNNTPEKMEAFAKAMRDFLQQKLETHQDGQYIDLSVDYSPRGNLSHIIKAAGLSDSQTAWPCKTGMSIRPGQVIAAMGYGAKPETLFEDKEIVEAEKFRIAETKRIYREKYNLRNATSIAQAASHKEEMKALSTENLFKIFYDYEDGGANANSRNVDDPEPVPEKFIPFLARNWAAGQELKSRGELSYYEF